MKRGRLHDLSNGCLSASRPRDGTNTGVTDRAPPLPHSTHPETEGRTEGPPVVLRRTRTKELHPIKFFFSVYDSNDRSTRNSTTIKSMINYHKNMVLDETTLDSYIDVRTMVLKRKDHCQRSRIYHE